MHLRSNVLEVKDYILFNLGDLFLHNPTFVQHYEREYRSVHSCFVLFFFKLSEFSI